jgi:hypothetical protein
MKTKHAAGYIAAISGIAIALGFVMLPNGSNALAQQQTNNTGNGPMMTMMPSGQQMSSNLAARMNSANWTSSVSLFSPVIDAIKSKIHTTLNDATTNALKAIGGAGSNSTAVAAFIHPERGFLVYDVFVLDPNDNIHRVIVDPGNGKVLSNQPMSLMAMMAMMHPSMGMGGPGMMDHGMMMQHGMMNHGMGMMGSQDNAWP